MSPSGTLMTLEKASRLAIELAETDREWNYLVVPAGDNMARISVHDETGASLGWL